METWNHPLSQKIVLPIHWRLRWTSQGSQHGVCFWQFCHIVLCCVCVLCFCCPRFCQTESFVLFCCPSICTVCAVQSFVTHCLVLFLCFVVVTRSFVTTYLLFMFELSEYLYSLCCPRFCHTSKVAEARCREYVKAFPPEIQTLPSLHMPTFNLEFATEKSYKLKFSLLLFWLLLKSFWIFLWFSLW